MDSQIQRFADPYSNMDEKIEFAKLVKNFNLQDSKGNTALHYIVSLDGSYKIDRLKKAADSGDERAIEAIRKRNELIKALVNNGADVTIKNKAGEDAFNLAVSDETGTIDMGLIGEMMRLRDENTVNTFDKLISEINEPYLNDDIIKDGLRAKKNYNINDKDQNGNTPLIHAVSKKKSEVVKVLLKAGADPNIPGQGGHMPLAYAINNRDGESGKYLINAGARCTY